MGLEALMSDCEYHCYPITTDSGLCKVYIGLSGNSIYIQLQPWAPRVLAKN